MTTFNLNANSMSFQTRPAELSDLPSPSITATLSSCVQRGYDMWTYICEWILKGYSQHPSISAAIHQAWTLFDVHNESALNAFGSSYTWSDVASLPALPAPAPIEASLQTIKDHLDLDAYNRLIRLTQSKSDWDGRGAAAMSLLSLFNFCKLLSERATIPNDVSLFLTFSGDIALSWISANGRVDAVIGETDIEIATDADEFFFEVGDNSIYSVLKEL